MPTPTYTPLANITLTTAVNGVTFSSIPATYRDLVIVFTGTTSATSQPKLRINGLTSTTYQHVRISGDGTSATSGPTGGSVGSSIFLGTLASSTTTNAVQCVINIFDYAQTNKHKTLTFRTDSATTATEAGVGRYPATNAVTNFLIFNGGAGTNWAIGSTFALYGIAG